MLIQLLAATNFLLGSYDAWLTQKRIKAFGVNFELNALVKMLAHPLGPELAAVIGILVPCVGWTYILFYLNLPVLLAILIGYNLKRFELQLSSSAYAKAALEIKCMIDEKLGENSGGNSNMRQMDEVTQETRVSNEVSRKER